MSASRPITLAFTGASGAPYGLRLLEMLLGAGRPVHLLISQAAHLVIGTETDLKLPSRPADIRRVLSERFGAAPEQLQVFGREQWTAPVASGSSLAEAMVVCPCTTGTLAAIAAGTSDNLIDRAADVMIKEQRKLILVVRETPFSALHLENMLKLARLGVMILPANPGFYNRPDSVEALVDFVVARVLDQLGIDQTLTARWGSRYESE